MERGESERVGGQSGRGGREVVRSTGGRFGSVRGRGQSAGCSGQSSGGGTGGKGGFKKICESLKNVLTRDTGSRTITRLNCLRTYSNLNQYVMHLCCFFSFLDIINPKGINLNKVVNASEAVLKKIPTFSLENFNYVEFDYENILYLVYRVVTFDNATNKIYGRVNFVVEMDMDKDVIVDMLTSWFSKGYNTKTLLKCSTYMIGILKSADKYYLFDPYCEYTLKNTGQPSCMLFECDDIGDVAHHIKHSLKQLGVRSGNFTATFISVNTLTPIHNHNNQSTHRVSEIEVPVDNKMYGKLNCLRTYSNLNQYVMHLCCFFTFLNITNPKAINLNKVVNASEAVLKKIPSFSLENFDYVEFDYENILYIVYRVVTLDNATNKIYSRVSFVIEMDKQAIANILTRWLLKGYNTKTILKCSTYIIGILKAADKYYLFDPYCEYTLKKTGQPSCMLFECDDIGDVAHHIKHSLKQLGVRSGNFTATFISVNTLTPIHNHNNESTHRVSEIEVPEDDTIREKYNLRGSSKTAANNNNILQEERNAELQREAERVAELRAQMTEEERNAELQRRRELRAQMTEEERNAELQREAERVAELRAQMTEEERNAELQRRRECQAELREKMTEAEKRDTQKKKQQYDERRRRQMPEEQRIAEKLKSKERFKKVAENCAEKREINLSLRKELQLRDKKVDIRERLVAALNTSGLGEACVRADKLINVNLHRREQLLNEVCKKCASFVYAFKACKARCDEKEDDTDKFMVMMGKSMHTESYFYDSTYKPGTDSTVALTEDGAVKVVPVDEAVDEDEEQKVKNKWECNDTCDIDQDMIYERFYSIIETTITATAKELIEFIDNIDDCSRKESADEKKMGHPHACYIHRLGSYSCKSKLLFFRCLCPHYPYIRNLTSTMYKIRKDLRGIKEIDDAVAAADIETLESIAEMVMEIAGENFVSSVEWPYAHENCITSKYMGAFVILNKIINDVPDTICISCLELCRPSKTHNITTFQPKKAVRSRWDDLQDYHENKGNTYHFMCNFCYGKFNDRNNKGEFPSKCILNKMEVKPTPKCIERLNDYERILIQRAKTFQVVTRMGGVSGKNRPRQEMIQKVIGRTFHLPLPLEKTLEKMPTPEQAIIPDQGVYILVRGTPTKQKTLWQSFVNVNYVYEALEWLKAANHLYKDIKLPTSADMLLDELDDVDVQFDSREIRTDVEEIEDEEKEALLTQKDPNDSFYEHITIHALGEERPNEDTSTVYQMKKVTDKPIDNRAKDLDVSCFPDLFCHGDNGVYADRDVPLAFGEFVKAKVKSVNSKFRLNIQYLFFLLSLINLKQIYSGVYTALNTTAYVVNLTAKNIKDKISNKEFDVDATNMFTRLRNSKAYWSKPRSDINCMTRNYGPATWFLTLSPSEYHWNDLEVYLRKVNGKKARGKTLSALIAMDPISTSRFIQIKFEGMLAFLCAPNGPLGKVAHYTWRREYQSRGLQHFHLLIWIEGAPILDVSSREEIAAFIIKYATCHIPDKTNFPTLYSRVLLYQNHYHNNYCKRTIKTKQGRFIKRCRFSFPRPITSKIEIRDVAKAIHGRRKLKLKSRLYDLPRNDEEININDYNPAILLAWEGNMDIQFIGEKSCALTSYITKYTTKPEKSFAGDGFADISANASLFSKLWMMGQRILSNRECGALEAADTLLQIPLFGTDIDTTIQWLDVRQQRNRKLKHWKHVDTLDDDDTDIFFESLIDTHYPNRPDGLEHLCLFDFASKYHIVNQKPKRSPIYWMYGKKYIVQRKKPILINHYNYNMAKDKENYFYALLLLFKVFRSESDLLESYTSYEESFNQFIEELERNESDAKELAKELGEDERESLLKRLEEYHGRIQEIAREKEALNEKVKDLEDEDKETEMSNSQNILEGHVVDDAIDDVRAIINVDDVSVEAINEMIAGLNPDQYRIFHDIVLYVELILSVSRLKFKTRHRQY